MSKRRQRELNLPPHRYIDNGRAWQACLDRLQHAPQFALDLESNSMYAYQEQICLIQISLPDQDYIVDPLDDFDLEELGDLIEDASIEKILHAAEYDLMLMKREHGWQLNNLFDTMWAARILGYDRVGLASMLEDLYGIKLDKRYQRANWCKRPLSAAQLAYAQADTHFLFRMRDDLAAALTKTGHMEEAEEIFAEQSHVQLPDTSFNPDDFWSINGTRRLPGPSKATLRELAIFRDKEARRRDLPHFKVFQDHTLSEIARTMPHTREELSRIRGMSSGQMRRYGHPVLEIVAENRKAPAPRRPRRNDRPPEAVLNRYDRLRTWRKERGAARGVESDVIMSRAALWAVARANPQTESELAAIAEIGDWRLQEYGSDILDLLRQS